MDYIQGLGFGVVSLSPFYQGDSTDTSTSLADFKAGDDMSITDHKAVGEKFGNLTSFQQLLDSAHDRGRCPLHLHMIRYDLIRVLYVHVYIFVINRM